MPARLLRTDTIANIVDFGAIEGTANPAANATANAAAFRAALGSGARRIAVPPGVWYFEEILFAGNPRLPFGVEIFGQGVEGDQQTYLRYRPTNNLTAPPAFFLAQGTSRSSVHDFRLDGPVPNLTYVPYTDGAGLPVPNVPPVCVGISADDSHHNHVYNVVLWDFEVGIQLNVGAANTYSNNVTIERFEISRCRTAFFLGNNNNGCTIRNGRIWRAIVGYDATAPGGAREEGVGIDIAGTLDTTFGPIGAHGVVISDVTIDGAVTCLRVAASHDLAVQGGFFEPGNPCENPQGTWPYGRARHRTIEVDEHTIGLTFQGTRFSEPSVPPGEENWTPTYVALPPEGRGVVDAQSTGRSGTAIGPGAYAINAAGASTSGTTAAHANKIKNADMSRGAMFWSSSGLIIVTPTTGTFVTGGASLLLQVNQAASEHIYQDFVVDSGVRSVTVNVRYSLRNSGVHAFRFELRDVVSNTRLGFFSDVGPGPSGWRVRGLTGRFDGLTGGVVGPRTLQVRVYPYNGDPMNLASQQVYVDSVWLVEGEYAASYRPYGEAIEMLAGDDREIFFSGVTTVNVGPVAAMPTNTPSNAIGMVVEMRISGSQSTTYGGTLTVDDQQGSNPTTSISATFDLRLSTAEVTIPLTPGMSPMWTVLVGNAANQVNYRVRLKKWILRP